MTQQHTKKGLQPWLKTGLLEKTAVLLASESAAVLLDLVTVRINALFTFGKLSEFQQLLYHPNCREHKPGSPWAGKELPDGKWSTRPILNSGENISIPQFPLGLPEKVAMDEELNCCSVSGIPMTGGLAASMSVKVTDDTINFTVKSETPHKAGLQFSFFPLYTFVVAEEEQHRLDYTEKTMITTAGRVRLDDESGRMPTLEISADKAMIVLTAYQDEREGFFLSSADPPKVNLSGLAIEINGTDPELQVELKIYPAHRQADFAKQITISSATPVDEQDAVRIMADTLLEIRNRCAETMPALSGLLPSAVNFRDLTPHKFDNTDYIVSTYMPRAIMSLTAASFATGDRIYAKAGAAMMREYLSRCPNVGDNNAVFVVGAFLESGKIKDAVYADTGELRNCFYHRPSNFAIVIRALLSLRRYFLSIADYPEADALLKQAVSVLKGLEYCFGLNWKYVNNPHYTLANLVLAMEKADHPESAWAREYLLTDLAARRYGLKIIELISICQAGAAESCPNTEQDFASIASEMMAVYLLTGEKRAATAAKAIAKTMTLNQRFFIDKPTLQGNSVVECLEHYDGGYRWGAYHGGMWDLVRMEMLLAITEFCDDGFSREAARQLYHSRMAWSFQDNGTVLGACQEVPGLSYRNREWSEIHNYGIFGLYLEAFFSGSGYSGNT